MQRSDPFNIQSRKLIDLTHVLGPNLPNFHVDGESFQYKKLFTVAKDGYAGGAFSTVEHYGTHVDAPSHFCEGKDSVDKIPVRDLLVPCVVLDVREEVNRDPDYRLTLEKIQSFEQGGKILDHEAVLLLTGWASRWEKSGAYRNADKNGTMHFPGFGAEAAEYLVSQRHVASLGIDTLSIDAGTSDTYSVHRKALSNGLYMMENLANLELVPARGALLICAPLPVKDGTGSPARVMAVAP